MSNLVERRNAGFDFLKYICAFLVICIHTNFYGRSVVVLVARAAVPVFFMITGYFYSSIVERNRQSDQIKKITIIAILSNALYFFWELLLEFVKSGSIIAKLISWLDVKLWVSFFLLNESPFRSHLWYLNALLYVLIIAWFLEKTDLRKKVYKLIPVLLGMNLILGNYSALLFGKAFPLSYSRNFLFIGLPFFLLGDLIFQHRNLKGMGNTRLLIMLISSLCITWAEYFLLAYHNANENQDFFLGTIGIAYSIFSLVKNNPEFFENRYSKYIAWMGRTLSLGLYVLNTIIRDIVSKGIEIIGKRIPVIQAISFYFMPLIMLIIVSCVTYFLLTCWKKITRRKIC